MNLQNTDFIRPIEGYNKRYCITATGAVWSTVSQKFLALRDNGHGYLLAWLYDENHKRKGYQVHRFVAQAFLPNPNNLSEINHKDENPYNNNVNNLEWCDRIYNNAYNNHHQKIQHTEEIKGMTRPVAMCDLKTHKIIKIFRVQEKGGRATGEAKHSQGICKCCSGIQKSAYGYFWKYVDGD